MATRLNQNSWMRLSDGGEFNGILSHLPDSNTRQRRRDSRADRQRHSFTSNSSRTSPSPTPNIWNSMEERELLRMEREFYDALGQDDRVNGEQIGTNDHGVYQNPAVEEHGPIDTVTDAPSNAHHGHAPSTQQEYHADHEQIPTDTGNTIPVHHTPPPQITRLIYSVWLPFLVVFIPNMAFTGVLLALVYADKWKSEGDAFSSGQDPEGNHDGYILVRMSPTRIAIITSCAATLAPFLTFAIMSLWRFRTVRYVRQSSGTGVDSQVELHHIPQVNLLLSLLGGSLAGLAKYIKKCCHKRLSRRREIERAAPITKPVHFTASILFICLFLVLSTWVADTIFHSLSDTVSVPEYSTPSSMNSFGLQLTDYCQNFDATKNLCLPCSWYVTGPTSEYWERTNKQSKIRMNISEEVQVQAIEPGLSILLPPSKRIPNTTDYRATTFGVSTQCKPITDKCNPHFLTQGDGDIRTVFNCSQGFRGINGQSPVVPMNETFTILDPNTPPLVIKRSSYLQTGFFPDEDFSVAYNPVNYNVSSPGWAINFGRSSEEGTTCPTGDQLLTTVHMAAAGRFGVLSTQAGIDLNQDPGLFSLYGSAFDFMFGCELTAYDVEYTWVRGGVRSYTLTPANSSLLTMYIGRTQYYQQAPQDDAAYDVNTMAVQGNSIAMADKWATLYSARILSVIGAYSDPRTNVAEQDRKDIFVARIHLGSLFFIVSCGASYVILICAVAISTLCCLLHHRNNNSNSNEGGGGSHALALRADVDGLSFEKHLEKQIALLDQQRELEPINTTTTTRVSSPRRQPSGTHPIADDRSTESLPTITTITTPTTTTTESSPDSTSRLRPERYGSGFRFPPETVPSSPPRPPRPHPPPPGFF